MIFRTAVAQVVLICFILFSNASFAQATIGADTPSSELREAQALQESYLELQRASERRIRALERSITLAKRPHWVCMLDVYPETAKKPEDGCTLVADADAARELVSERRQILEYVIATTMACGGLLIALVIIQITWRRLSAAVTRSAGAMAERTAEAAKASARVVGRASVVVGERTAGIAEAFREGRETELRRRSEDL